VARIVTHTARGINLAREAVTGVEDVDHFSATPTDGCAQIRLA